MTNEKQSLPSTLYTEEYFLTACEGFDVFVESEGQHLSRRLKDSFKIAEVQPGMKILDIGCGRGEILRHCMRLGIEAYGVDYAQAATEMTLAVIESERAAGNSSEKSGVCRCDAKHLPFPNQYFDRILMFDVVEHLYPWELQEAILEVGRVLKDDGLFIVHTAPNKWYDLYAYPWVRRFRLMIGADPANYPEDPRAITPVNQHVHVNEQDILSMRRALADAGFKGKIWLDSPPQPEEVGFLGSLRKFLFRIPPFHWFFERELFAVAKKANL